MQPPLRSTLKYLTLTLFLPLLLYTVLLSLLLIFPALETQLIYLHSFPLSPLASLNTPTTYGFLSNQVSSFPLTTPDNETLHAWHILPLSVYLHSKPSLFSQPPGFNHEITTQFSLHLLKSDPKAKLLIYFHGAAGTVASGYRPASYHSFSSLSAENIHILTFDYRGYGLSTGTPSEEGLLTDAIAVVDFALQTAGISPARIVLFGQSLGTGVAISVASYFSLQNPPVSFSGIVLVAAFEDVPSLTSTYKIAGVIPILSPLALFPKLLGFFHAYLRNTWLSGERIEGFVKRCEEVGMWYHVTFIHAQDDYDIPVLHTENLVRRAVVAGRGCVGGSGKGRRSVSEAEKAPFEQEKETQIQHDSDGSWSIQYESSSGLGTVREERLKFGDHDKLMAYPVTALAVLRAFRHREEFGP